MRRLSLTCPLAILGLSLFAGCTSDNTEYYTEPQALEAMRRTAPAPDTTPELAPVNTPNVEATSAHN